MPLDPAYQTDAGTIPIGDLVRAPGSGSGSIEDGETGTVIALESSCTGPCKRTGGHLKWFGQGRPLASPGPPLDSFLSNYAMEDLRDRGSGDPTAEPDQLTLHPPVPPRDSPPRYGHEFADRSRQARPGVMSQ